MKPVGLFIHSSPWSATILSQINPVNAVILLLEYNFNMFLPSTPRSFKWSLWGFSTKPWIIQIFCPNSCYSPLPSHSWFDDPISIGDSTCSLLHCPVTSSHLDQSIFLSTLFSNTLSPYSCLSVRFTEEKGTNYMRTGSVTLCSNLYPVCAQHHSCPHTHTHIWHKLLTTHTHCNLCRIRLHTITNGTYSLYLCVILWTYLIVFIKPTSCLMRILWLLDSPAQSNNAGVYAPCWNVSVRELLLTNW
jgi:hypothetical protein